MATCINFQQHTSHFPRSYNSCHPFLPTSEMFLWLSVVGHLLAEYFDEYNYYIFFFSFLYYSVKLSLYLNHVFFNISNQICIIQFLNVKKLSNTYIVCEKLWHSGFSMIIKYQNCFYHFAFIFIFEIYKMAERREDWNECRSHWWRYQKPCHQPGQLEATTLKKRVKKCVKHAIKFDLLDKYIIGLSRSDLSKG